MDPELRRELREMNEKLNGVCASVESSFGSIRRDIYYLGRAYIPALIVGLIGLVLAISSLVIALDTRNQVLSVSAQTTKNTRDLENIFPLIFPLPNVTTPKE